MAVDTERPTAEATAVEAEEDMVVEVEEDTLMDLEVVVVETACLVSELVWATLTGANRLSPSLRKSTSTLFLLKP